MSYDEQIAQNEQQLQKNISVGMEVKATLETPGWKKTIKPLLDKMISDVLGGKIENYWSLGCLFKKDNLGKEEFFIGYKQSLVELNNYVYKLADQIKTCEEKLKSIEAGKKAGDIHPMLDGPYGKEKAPHGKS